ncbi:hypothetical protein HNP84_004740 [Thermocatellispora tengchongensis]|uniref:Uncharacterized protein n=1 Tax=Thermocatellispora tengchongensis TaxID=1073253 RepID=A0A840P8R1_9ACTN|nr:hypothetical protein [Thermocatellispora tengchongensis]MBB5135006.1 hypothetical protein [Thermocatellispora tengchongensis]
MTKIRTIVAGAAVAAALSIGLAAAPAQAATPAAAPVKAATSAKVTAQDGAATTFGRTFKYWADSHDGYFKGYWYKKHGFYYFGGDLVDVDRGDREYTYVWFKWYDKFGRFHQNYYKTFGKIHFKDFIFKKDFDVRVCEGDHKLDNCGGWHDVF